MNLPAIARISVLLLCAAALDATPQSQQITLDPETGWSTAAQPEESLDRSILNIARRLIADEEPKRARAVLTDWLRRHQGLNHPDEPEALRLRGDALLAAGREYQALFEYELVIQGFPDSSEYITAIEREVDIAEMYLAGLKRRFLGLPLRLNSSNFTAQEILIRTQERLPGSRLAERAAIRLADYYFENRDLSLAAEMYEIFLTNYPESPFRRHAMRNRVSANIAGFKGPDYDGLALLESRFLVQQFAREYPADPDRAFINEALVASIDESAAEQQLNVARWYLKQGDEASANFTIRRLLRDQPGTVAAARGIQILESNGWLTPAQDQANQQPELQGPNPEPQP